MTPDDRASQAILTVRDLTKRFGDRTVLDAVNLDAAVGQTLAVTGPSGSGKSTFLNIVGSLDQATPGEIVVAGQPIGVLQDAALASYRATTVGFVFQDHHLLPQLTALENVSMPSLAVSSPASLDDARALLRAVEVDHRADAFPSQMSGGERQRVALARALINGPKLLLCDEPTGNLDADTGRQVVNLLLALAQDRGLTVLMATHNDDHASRLSRRLRLTGGRLEE